MNKVAQIKKPKWWLYAMVTIVIAGYLFYRVSESITGSLVDISFVKAGSGYGDNNEHQIYQNSSGNNDWGEGPLITDPVWIADGPDANNDPDKNEPTLYRRSKVGAPSRLKVDVTIKVEPAGTKFSLAGSEGSVINFRADNIKATGAAQTVSMISKVDLPQTVSMLTKTFNWRIAKTAGGPGYDLGSSTHKIYIVYDTPFTANVEGQANKLTPKRLNFVIGGASGKSTLQDVVDAVTGTVSKKISGSYGSFLGDEKTNRWLFYARKYVSNLDCHNRAALAVSALGVVGVKALVTQVYPTLHPVPTHPIAGNTNSTVNDYVSGYNQTRKKWGKDIDSGKIAHLMFSGNNFEGGLVTKDGSTDDGHVWITIWPYSKHSMSKQYLKWYASSFSQYWHDHQGDGPSKSTVIPVPLNKLANKPKALGGPN
ncbi:MAG: hypothetical protein GQ542_13910 [Desulforhopalus sp.]|nr:hypothetical protein [Desulforhopalus sp.]